MQAALRSRNRPSGNVHGVLIVDKPGGITSHGVVSHIRRIFGTRRVGHAGTLDPMATGVLVLLLGEATKLSSLLTTERKTYEARVFFGTATDSLDADGRITKRVSLEPGWLDEIRLTAALESERSRRLQIPPQVSAIKVNGERAYARARKGETTELKARDVLVHELTLLKRDEFSVTLRACVSKGYYIRSLAHDLGQILGVPAHLLSLRRVQSGPFTIEKAVSWPVTDSAPLLPIGDAAHLTLPCFDVSSDGALRLRQGKHITSEHFTKHMVEAAPLVFAAFFESALIALVEPCADGEFRVKRGINDPSLAPLPLPQRPEDE